MPETLSLFSSVNLRSTYLSSQLHDSQLQPIDTLLPTTPVAKAFPFFLLFPPKEAKPPKKKKGGGLRPARSDCG